MNRRFAERAGAAVLPIPSQSRYEGFFDATEIAIGDSSQTYPTAGIVKDLSEIEKLMGRSIDGLIGAPIMHDKTIIFDFLSNEVQFSTDSNNKADRSLPVFFDYAGRPNIWKIDLGNKTRREFLIDTGKNLSLSLDERAFEECRKSGAIRDVREVNALRFSSNSSAKTRMGIASEVKVAGYRFKNVPVASLSGLSHCLNV